MTSAGCETPVSVELRGAREGAWPGWSTRRGGRDNTLSLTTRPGRQPKPACPTPAPGPGSSLLQIKAVRATCCLSAAQLPKSPEAVTSFLRVTYGAHTVKEGAPSPSGYDGGRFQLVSRMPHTFRRD